MKYIIMCGGNYHTNTPKHLRIFKNETIVARTIRLLKENGVTDITISSNNQIFDTFGLPVLHHENNYGDGGQWIEAFYPTDEPACYIFGDVIFSENAIKTIVNTETDSVEFFASAPPFHKYYTKNWAEPFAFKVADQNYFRECIILCLNLAKRKAFKRGPIAWELWQVIKKTPINIIDYTNYTVINDWTTDCDTEEEYNDFMKKIKEYNI